MSAFLVKNADFFRPVLHSLAFSSVTWPGNSEGKTAHASFNFALRDVIRVTSGKGFSSFQHLNFIFMPEFSSRGISYDD